MSIAVKMSFHLKIDNLLRYLIFNAEIGEKAWSICVSKYVLYNMNQNSHKIMQYNSWKTPIYVKDWQGVHVIPQ